MLILRGDRNRRRGSATLWTLISLPVLLAALALALNAGWLSTAALELKTAGDSASLAGVDELASDEWLRAGQPGVSDLLDRVRLRATDYAAWNRTLGQPVNLLPDQGDVVVGAIDATGTFIPADTANPAALTLDAADAILVKARRLRGRGTGIPLLLGALVLQPVADLQALSVARLDRDVIGFRARPNNPIPLVPYGLRSDPTGTDPKSWENRIRDRNGPDDFTFDPSAGFSLGSGGDGIPEFDAELQLPPSGDPAASNAFLLQIGAGTPGAQVTAGVSAEDLAASDGKFVLGAGNTIPVSGTALGPAMGTSGYAQLRDGLEQLRQNRLVRIWPLVSVFDTASSQATVNAFVAARVVRIEEPAGGPLRVRLQPALRTVPHALTDAALRGAAHFVPNPYFGRPRLTR